MEKAIPTKMYEFVGDASDNLNLKKMKTCIFSRQVQEDIGKAW